MVKREGRRGREIEKEGWRWGEGRCRE